MTMKHMLFAAALLASVSCAQAEPFDAMALQLSDQSPEARQAISDFYKLNPDAQVSYLAKMTGYNINWLQTGDAKSQIVRGRLLPKVVG
jgi:hypothetical protein